MSAARIYRRSIGAANRPLTEQFIHDSNPLIRYSGGAGWSQFLNTDDNYRNHDTMAAPGGSTVDFSQTIVFTSQGRADEWVTLHGYTTYAWQAFLNDVLVAERTPDVLYVAYSANVQEMTGGYFYDRQLGLYSQPLLKMRPNYGRNRLRLVCRATSNATFLDGAGLNVRGGPRPY